MPGEIPKDTPDAIQTKAEEGRSKLSEQYAEHVFRIETDKGTACGFRTPDGRIVTTANVIGEGTRITAEQNGKRYPLGQSILIDDINNIAVLEFAEAPKLSATPLHIATTPLAPGQQLGVIDCSPGQPPRTLRSTLEGQIRQDEFRYKNGQTPRIELSMTTSDIKDLVAFSTRPILKLRSDGFAAPGSPVIANGEIVGMTTSFHERPQTDYAIPATSIANLLAELPESSKFRVTTGYENGFQKYVRDWSRAPRYAAENTALAGTFCGGLTAAGQRGAYDGLTLAGQRGAGILPVAVLAAANGYVAVSDVKGLLGSTSNLDFKYYGLAVAADAISFSGMGVCLASNWNPKLRPLGIGLTSLGLAGRLSCEAIPKHLVVQSITRSDNEQRPPFIR